MPTSEPKYNGNLPADCRDQDCDGHYGTPGDARLVEFLWKGMSISELAALMRAEADEDERTVRVLIAE
jgi:hypothetical protein